MESYDISQKTLLYPETTKPLIKFTCFYTGGYPVCKNTTEVYYTDTEKWGVENDAWCIMCY